MSKQPLEASWRNLRGKKTYHPLQPEMLRDGVDKVLDTRPTPFSQYPGNARYKIRFDREYAIEKVRSDLTLPLKEIPLVDVLTLAIEAWCLDHPDYSAEKLAQGLSQIAEVTQAVY